MNCERGPEIGARYHGGECDFTVWAPFANTLELKFLHPSPTLIPMQRDRFGYWSASAALGPGGEYLYRIDKETERPDPASSFQPRGVHGPSQVVDHTAFPWTDKDWRGVPLRDMIIYEAHVGTFTPEGTFFAIVPRLPDLKKLGVTALELMPVAQFPGERNWGYDGTYPFAVHNSYGGPDGLKALVNACHAHGISVILDVVYNHLGPEGNYLRDFGPYFTPRYNTPWGEAFNFDDAYNDGVRNFFIRNALAWLRDYHIDALRLDAVHGITDMSAFPFLRELAAEVREFSSREGKMSFLFAESDLNDPRIIRPEELGGLGMHAQWCDDFHHAIHALVTGEQDGYYCDFGGVQPLTKALRQGYVYTNDYSRYRKKYHGSSAADRRPDQFVVFLQNHDQTGNRMCGERLSNLVPFETLKLSAGVLLLSPFIPLLFMGEEYGEEAPFLYFTSHSEIELIEAVRSGRKNEFRDFKWQREPPDPASTDTFYQSKIRWEKRTSGSHAVLLDFYRELIALRKSLDVFSCDGKSELAVCGDETSGVVTLLRRRESRCALNIMNFSRNDEPVRVPLPYGTWEKVLDSSEERWSGPGAHLPHILRHREEARINFQGIAVFLSKE